MRLQLLKAKDQFITADQKLVAIHCVLFVVEQLFCRHFQNHLSKTEVSKCL